MKKFLIVFVLLVAACSTPPKQVAPTPAPTPAVGELKTEVVRELRLKKPLEKGRESFVVSASALVKRGDQLFTVADDDNAIFAIEKSRLKIVWQGEKLPVDNKARKKIKPDFEGLLLLSADEWQPAGALVAWPSASGPNRQKAVILPFTKRGKKFGVAKTIDIAPLAEKLKNEEKFLNMEGIFSRGDDIFLVQRGNAPGARSGLFKIAKKEWLTAMYWGDWSKVTPSFEKFELGAWEGVPLALAEAHVTSLGVLALATGEKTDDKLQDGSVSGTMLVRLDDGGKVTRLGHFPKGIKFEGFVLEPGDKTLLLVDDADQTTIPSKLYRAWLP